MAKKNERNNERKAIVEQMRRQQARKERTRSIAILGVCIVVVIALLGLAIGKYVSDQREQAKGQLQNLGATAAAASCSPVTTKDATGNQDHVQDGTKMSYPDSPPAFGKHWGTFLSGTQIRALYTTTDRPDLGQLVHSLEHGYTILWYDDTVKKGTKAYKDVQAIAAKLPVGNKFIAAPWKSDDGKAFPSGKHLALTHWTGPDNQKGATQYCGKPSGAVVKKFMATYPEGDAPEPGGV